MNPAPIIDLIVGLGSLVVGLFLLWFAGVVTPVLHKKTLESSEMARLLPGMARAAAGMQKLGLMVAGIILVLTGVLATLAYFASLFGVNIYQYVGLGI